MFGLRKKNANANKPTYLGTMPHVDKRFSRDSYGTGKMAGNAGTGTEPPAANHVGQAGTDVRGGAGGSGRSLYDVQFLPEGISVKRVFSRKGINKWMAHRQGTKTEYYSPTLDGALSELFKNNVESLSKYNVNAKLAGGTRS